MGNGRTVPSDHADGRLAQADAAPKPDVADEGRREDGDRPARAQELDRREVREEGAHEERVADDEGGCEEEDPEYLEGKARFRRSEGG